MKGLNGRLRPATGKEGGPIVQRLKNSRRFAAALVLITTGIAVAFAGSAGTGNAAPGVTMTFEPLLGTNVINEIQTVSYGKGIGFHLVIANQGTNSTPQTSSVVVTSDFASYDDTGGGAAATFTRGTTTTTVVCTKPSNNQMVCQLPTGTLQPGDKFEAFFRFIAPTSTAIAQVKTTATLSVAAQTVGGNKTKGTTLTSGELKTNLTSEVTTDNAYLKKTETASTGVFGDLTSGHPQNFSLTAPAGLLNGAFGVAVGIHDRIGDPDCVGVLSSCTTLNIPAAHFADALGNPFYNGIAAAPYTWNMNAQYSAGTIKGVVHVDDNGVEHELKDCAAIGGPSLAEPLCINGPVQTTSNPKTVHATGQGLENGGLGWN
jgi:hypothetical protein